MAEQDVLDKIEELITQVEEVDGKLDDVMARVNADSELCYVCGNCGDGLVGGAGCTHCGGTGVRKSAKVKKVEE